MQKIGKGRIMIYVSNIVFDNKLDRESYLNDLPIVRYLQENKKLSFTSDVTFFVGENGTGKSTLLEAIAVAFGCNAEGGSRNSNFSTNDTHSELFSHLSLYKTAHPKDGFFLRAESLYNVATNVDEIGVSGYGEISLHEQSHGESFLALVQNRFWGKGLYILDEPEAALSPMRILTLMLEIKRLSENSQFIIATHSPILMAFPNAEVLEFSENGIQSVDYQETEHFKVTKSFLDSPERMLHFLFED